MASWEEFHRSAPEFADAVKERFDAGVHKVLATLHRDGAPRVSGTETTFVDGELWLGMMPGSRKLQDLRRDPRVALHSASPDPEGAEWSGDAKLSGRAVEVADPETVTRVVRASGHEGEVDPAGMSLFRVDIANAVCTYVEGGALIVEHWSQDEGVRRTERR